MRRVKHILSYVLVLSMCFTLLFMPKYTVFAESTYIEYTANTCWDSTLGNYHTNFISDVNVRITYISSSLSTANSQKFIYFVTTENGLFVRNNGSTTVGCSVPNYSYTSDTVRSIISIFKIRSTNKIISISPSTLTIIIS